MLDALAHAANAAECELETVATQEYRAYKLRRTDPVVQVAWGALEALRLRAEPARHGRRRRRALFNERGIPCVNLANGMELIHTPDERIAVADVEAWSASRSRSSRARAASARSDSARGARRHRTAGLHWRPVIPTRG